MDRLLQVLQPLFPLVSLCNNTIIAQRNKDCRPERAGHTSDLELTQLAYPMLALQVLDVLGTVILSSTHACRKSIADPDRASLSTMLSFYFLIV